MASQPIPPFVETLSRRGLTCVRTSLETLQINLGKRCNQACLHCHVEAGPKRTEMMTRETAERVIDLLKDAPEVKTVDITGGAPELNENFRYLVESSTALGKKVMDRCNLTVLFEEGQEDTAEFLRDHQVEVVASLPCYSEKNVDKQRGGGVFDRSIRAIQLLNKLGYGQQDSKLVLNLVYNPLGASLPPEQKALEDSYKVKLRENFGLEFNQLYTLANMPISRFNWDLKRSNQWEAYMALLIENFNPSAVPGVMCRSLISVSWDGKLYDCDFNQMLEIPVPGSATSIWDINSLDGFSSGKIAFESHCYGCTAGAGSSCGGALSD